MQTEKIIEVQNLCKQYDTYQRGDSLWETVKSLFHRKKVVVKAVRDVSFSIKEGEIVGLLGENGAGKSTTIKMLTGVLFPSSGNIRVMGYTPFAQRKRYVKHIGAVFGQKSQLIWDIPPVDSFVLNKAVYDIPDAEYKQRLDAMVALLGIEQIVQKPTRVLSLGERMKCEFVMAMLHNPPVVFLDEPTIGLDVLAKQAIRGFIQQMNKQGTTFILTTHDLEDVEQLAQRVIVINHGQKVFEDTLPALQHFLGDKKNIHITMRGPVLVEGALQRPGIEVLTQASAREASLLVDGAVLPMDDFLALLSRLGHIQDISIKEMGMDTIVQAIYTGQRA